MRNAESLTAEQMGGFVEGSAGIEFAGRDRAETYRWVQDVLVEREYATRSREERGLVRAYLEKVTGLGPAQMTRLIRQYRETGRVEARPYRRRRFPSRYLDADIALLAEVDRAHEFLNGAATRCILKREYEEFGHQEYERLAQISVSHLYNLRASTAYRRRAAVFEETRSSPVSIGERRKPDPEGKPGHIRIDTVHQGDRDGIKGVYHINAVDTVTQWQVVGCAERISEAFLMPVLESMLHQFPFQIKGFHSDNGSEYINYPVAEMLEKMRVEFTKSRSCRSQDNALVEGKNGAVIRKLIGYGHIEGAHAETMRKFYAAHLNPYLNYHRPCGFATVGLDEKGRRKRTYKPEDYATPYQKLKSLPGAGEFLKEGITFEYLDRQAGALSDTESAQKMGAAKAALLAAVKSESPVPPRIFL